MFIGVLTLFLIIFVASHECSTAFMIALTVIFIISFIIAMKG